MDNKLAFKNKISDLPHQKVHDNLVEKGINVFDFDLRNSFCVENARYGRFSCPSFPLCIVLIRKNGHNMLVLLLDSKYKNMHLVTTYLGHENVVTLVVDYDEKSSFLLLLEAFKGLMPSKSTCLHNEFTSFVVFHDIFQQTNTSANSYKDIVIRELDRFCHYHIDGKTINVL